jgi:hypothetical protein
MMEIELDIDEFHEAVLALDLMSEQLSKIVKSGDPYFWPWVIVALHNAIQGFMVLALRGTNNLAVLTEECAAEWLAAYERGDGKYPRQRLDEFLNLYKKIKSKAMNIYVNSRIFKPTGTQGKSVKQLNSWRNDFIHFVPSGWMITVDGFVQIVQDCLDIITFLAFESGNIRWHNPGLETKTKTIIEKARNDVRILQQAYSA